jgi:hypothetical protein
VSEDSVEGIDDNQRYHLRERDDNGIVRPVIGNGDIKTRGAAPTILGEMTGDDSAAIGLSPPYQARP